MTKFALFDPAVSSNSPVTGWYDTEEFAYKNLPEASSLLPVTDVQWGARLIDPAGWAVTNGALVPLTQSESS